MGEHDNLEERFRAFTEECEFWLNRFNLQSEGPDNWTHLVYSKEGKSVEPASDEGYEGIRTAYDDWSLAEALRMGDDFLRQSLVEEWEDLPWFVYVGEYRLLYKDRMERERWVGLSGKDFYTFAANYSGQDNFSVSLLFAKEDPDVLSTLEYIREWLKTNKPMIHQERYGAKWLKESKVYERFKEKYSDALKELGDN